MKKSDDGNKVFYMEDDIEFELLKMIGEGGFCKVYRAIGTYLNCFEDDGVTPEKIPYAVKVFDRNELKRKQAPPTGNLKPRTMLKMMEDETEIVGMLKNPYINKAFFLFDNEKIPKIYLVMQFADLGNLGELQATDNTFQINERVYNRIVKDIEERITPQVFEDYDAVNAEVRFLVEGKVFGPECLSMRERVAKFIFY